MAKDVKDVGGVIGNAIGRVAREAAESVSNDGRSGPLRNGSGALTGMRGVAAGAALATAAPLAARGAGKLVKSSAMKRLAPSVPGGNSGGAGLGHKIAKGVKKTVSGGVKDAVGKNIDQSGGVSRIAKEAGKSVIPGAGGDSKGKNEAPGGVGKGRRMPVEQAVDIGVPLSTAYNQWTQFEEWPQFMHRLQQVTQEDDCTVSFKTKMWGISKEFEAQIVEQRPDDRIKWNTTEGITHTGVVTFHELEDRLTRVQVTFDLEPGSLLEKAARGMRHVKRAVRADMARFKAFIEMREEETGAWRGVIKDGEVVTKNARQTQRTGSSSRRRSSRSSRSGRGHSRSSTSARSRSSSSPRSTSSSRGRSSGRRSGSSSRSGSRSSRTRASTRS
jgi:uncharacterized membrane protein